VSTKYPIEVRQGDTFKLTVTYKSGGDPVDLTGYTYGFVVNGELFDDAPHVVPQSPLDEGTIVLTLPADFTADLTGAGEYAFYVVSPDGDVTTLLNGVLDVDLS